MKAPPGSTAQKVNNVMDSMSSAEIYDILMSLKEDPEAGKRHLQTNPSLAYALLQAQVILGYIPVDKGSTYFIGHEDSSSSSVMAVDVPQSGPSNSFAPPQQPHPHMSAPPHMHPQAHHQPLTHQNHPSSSHAAPPPSASYPPPQQSHQPPSQPQHPSQSHHPSQPQLKGQHPAQQPPQLRDLVRMPPAQLEHLQLPDTLKTLVNIVHSWSQRTLSDWEKLSPQQQQQIKLIFDQAQMPLPMRR